MEVTILMPCLNEAETLADCIAAAQEGLSNAGVEGEILIADNGSSGSAGQPVNRRRRLNGSSLRYNPYGLRSDT